MKTTYTNRNKIRKNINRYRKQIWYCELIIAACVGASITLIGVITHMMIAGPAWTW